MAEQKAKVVHGPGPRGMGAQLHQDHPPSQQQQLNMT